MVRDFPRPAIVILSITVLAVAVLLFGGAGLPPRSVWFSQSTKDLKAYDFVEITAQVSAPHASNPFTDAVIRGTFERVTDGKRWQVEGFCDAEDGSVYRIRFMPPAPGDYVYSVDYRQGWSSTTSTGTFHASDGRLRGPIRIDPRNRWHFVWEGTGEHYFFNGTTAYWLIGWRDDQVIEFSIERLHRLKINRIRVTIAGRTSVFYGEPVMASGSWTSFIAPWPTATGVRYLHLLGRAGQRYGFGLGRGVFDSLATLGTPEDIYHPSFDYSRFQVAYWQKFERALRFARDRDVIFSLVLDMNDSRVHPAQGSADEHRFIQYAVARFGAFSNITWDLGDDLDQYRDDEWTRATGTLIKELDPYRHLATSHPVDNVHQDRTADWFDFTSFQEWSRAQHAFMLGERKEQARLGRIIPQTNEEYGYEDHYPLWANGPGSELRRYAAPNGLGNRDGRGIPNQWRDRASRNECVARYGWGMDERPRRRHHDHVQGIRAHGRFLHELRLVGRRATRRAGEQGELLPGEARGDLRPVPPPRRLCDRANSAGAVRCHVVGSGDRPADRSTVLQRHRTLVDLACGTWRGRLGPSLEAKAACHR